MIYDVYENKILIENKIELFHIDKIEIYADNKLFIYDEEAIIFFEIIDDKINNKYKFNKLNKLLINENIYNILVQNDKLIINLFNSSQYYYEYNFIMTLKIYDINNFEFISKI